MEIENGSKEINPGPITFESAIKARQEFLATEIREAFIKFVDALQKEADERFPGPERDLWFNFQLTQVYVDAKMWERASEAAEDALTVASNMGEDQWQEHFEAMRQEIEENLTGPSFAVNG